MSKSYYHASQEAAHSTMNASHYLVDSGDQFDVILVKFWRARLLESPNLYTVGAFKSIAQCHSLPMK
jgi:hypothetical protein